MKERLQKVLAREGLGSRRMLENWIRQGRIRVDGQTALLGCTVDLHTRIEIDGRPIRLAIRPEEAQDGRLTRVLLYHKPEGSICTRHDPEGRMTIYDDLPRLKAGRWISVGRLDYNTSGLLVLTNDGPLAHVMMHPRFALEREYAVRVLGTVTEVQIQALRRGVLLEDGMARFDAIHHAGGEGANQWYHVILKQGRKREVRRLWESQGLRVSRFCRVV
jgi:23S rRNA pseudouridine2605 synthase